MPDLRFGGFEERWESVILNDVVEQVTRKNQRLESTFALTISAKDGLIKQEDFFTKTVASANLKGYYLMKNGDFAYNKSTSKGFPWGVVKRLERYDKGVLSPLYIVFSPLNINSNFLAKYFDSSHWNKEISERIKLGARNHGALNIDQSDFFDMHIGIPKNLDEQEKIGTLFLMIDQLTDLHKNALELLKLEKRVLSSKMFPQQNGESIEIEHTGFSSVWKKVKLKDLYKKGGAGRTPATRHKAYYEGKIPFLSISDLTHSEGFIENTVRHISEEGVKKSNNWIVPKGAISFAMYASVGKLAILNTEVATSQAFYNMVFSDYYLRDFVYQRLIKASENHEWNRMISTGTQANLNASKVKNFEFKIPKDKQELAQISQLLMSLDYRIRCCKFKLETFKIMKQTLLHGMFE